MFRKKNVALVKKNSTYIVLFGHNPAYIDNKYQCSYIASRLMPYFKLHVVHENF